VRFQRETILDQTLLTFQLNVELPGLFLLKTGGLKQNQKKKLSTIIIVWLQWKRAMGYKLKNKTQYYHFADMHDLKHEGKIFSKWRHFHYWKWNL